MHPRVLGLFHVPQKVLLLVLGHGRQRAAVLQALHLRQAQTFEGVYRRGGSPVGVHPLIAVVDEYVGEGDGRRVFVLVRHGHVRRGFLQRRQF